jgi:hypothetical protein
VCPQKSDTKVVSSRDRPALSIQVTHNSILIDSIEVVPGTEQSSTGDNPTRPMASRKQFGLDLPD